MLNEYNPESEVVVPDASVANVIPGSPRLDPDPIDDATLDLLDKELDAAGEGIDETTPEPAAPATTEPDVDLLSDETSQPVETPATPQIDENLSKTPVNEPQQPVLETPQADLDPEIAAIEQPRNLSEANSNNWKKLQETASRYKKEAQEAEILRQRLVEMEQQQVQKPADYDELKKFKQIFDMKNDPELKSKYEAPINEAKEGIYAILKKNGASDETIASIEQVGGPDKVSGAWWKQNVLDKLELLDSKKLEQNLVKVADLKEQQEKEYTELATKGEEILRARHEEKKNWYQTESQQINTHLAELTKDHEWARFVEPKPDATPEQIAAIQQHNAKVQDLAAKFQSALWPTDAKTRTEVAAAAVYSHVISEHLQQERAVRAQLETKLRQLEAENSQLKVAGRAPKASASTTNGNKITTNSNDRLRMNALDAIDLGLDEAAV
jgi:hypothetical protein